MEWRAEIIRMHDFLERFFRGQEDSVKPFADVLAAEFTMVDPHGRLHNREAVIEAVEGGRGRSDSITITTSDHALLADRGDTLIAQYIEAHEFSDRSNRRWTTVVFIADPAQPNGVSWLRVHETWIADHD